MLCPVVKVSESVYNAFFVDLFVRVSNALAISMYNAFGYSVYRRVLGYYSGKEDAFGKLTLKNVVKNTNKTNFPAAKKVALVR